MTAIVLQTANQELLPAADRLELAGHIANQVMARGVLADYRERQAANTRRRQEADLAVFVTYLGEAGLGAGDLAHDAEAWRGVTWGIVAGFARWMLDQGYAVGSVNVRLSTVKTYCKLAFKAGVLDATEHALIRAVAGYSRKEAKHVDETRATTRVGPKKAEWVSLSKEQAAELKAQPDTPQGRRDALLVGLLLDLGLRCGEVAGLTVTDVNLKAGVLTFYRAKVDKVQTHRLTNGLLRTMQAYMANDAPAMGPLLRESRKDSTLAEAGMNERGITKRVRELGERVGISGLSAHDCRHYWATTAARNGTPIDRLQDAGGWTSPYMALRYVEAAKIANEGVKLE